MDKVSNSVSITFQCDNGYNIQGSNSLKCVDGNWSTSSQPECLPAPCVLPEVMHAVYQGGYRAGLTIAHGSHVMVQCDIGIQDPIPPTQMDCALGSLTPQTISCSFSPSRKSRDDDVINFVADEGNLTNSIEENDCGPPSRELAMLIYKNEEAEGESEETYPAGTEISFNCIASSVTGERTTWKIICEDGNWIGRAHDCGNLNRLYCCKIFETFF